MLNPDLSFFENTVDPDQLASNKVSLHQSTSLLCVCKHAVVALYRLHIRTGSSEPLMLAYTLSINAKSSFILILVILTIFMNFSSLILLINLKPSSCKHVFSIKSGKHCGSRSDGFVGSQLILIYSVFKRINPGSAGQELTVHAGS